MVTRARSGVGQVGCLLMLAVVAAAGYFSLGVGQVYWNYRDRMQQEARFAGSRTDGVIKRRISAFADSLGLPEGARQVRVRRAAKHIYIWAEYYENIELPFLSRELLLSPRAEWTY